MFSKLGSIKVAAAIVGISVSGFSGEAQAVTFNFTTTNSGYSLEKNFSAGGINSVAERGYRSGLPQALQKQSCSIIPER